MGEGRQKWVTEDLQRQKKKGNVQLHLEPWSLLHCPFPCRCNFYLSHFFFLSITSPPLHLHRPLLAAPVLSVCYWERNGFRCTKKKKKTQDRFKNTRGRGAPEAAAAVVLTVFLLSFFTALPHRCTRGDAATAEHQTWRISCLPH